MAEEKRVRRTTEQMICAIDEDIAALRESIKVIEEKKAASAAAFDKKIETVETKIAKLNERKKKFAESQKAKTPQDQSPADEGAASFGPEKRLKTGRNRRTAWPGIT